VEFIVYSSVFSTSADMSKTAEFPSFEFASNNLRVTCNYKEGQFCLRTVQVCDEIKQSFSYTDALIIGQNNQSAYTIVFGFHLCACYGNEGYGFVLVECSVASNPRA
jgi:hypothetical protein